MSRVLLVHQPVDGGVARHVADLAVGLRARGHEAILCGPAEPVQLSGQVRPGEHVTLPMQRAVSPRPDGRAARRFAAIVDAVRPDIIHAHSSKAGAVARLARIAHPRIPTVYTPHLFASAGWFDSELERAVYREFERTLGLLTSRLVAVCEAEARVARAVLGRRRVRVVHNGIGAVAPVAPDPAVAALRSRGPVVCCVAQLRPQKGVPTLLEAWSAVVARVPEAQLVVAGGGELREALERQVADAGTGRSVHFLGEHPDPMSVLAAADLFALPSWAEAFPYAVLEAMALERAIVATDVGGVAEAVTDGVSGRIVPARDPVALSDALTELLADEALRDRLAAAGRADVARRFTIDAMVDGITAVYDELTPAR